MKRSKKTTAGTPATIPPIVLDPDGLVGLDDMLVDDDGVSAGPVTTHIFPAAADVAAAKAFKPAPGTFANYYPELSRWKPIDETPGTCHAFDVCEEDAAGKRGRTIATITVDPSFTPEAALSIARLASFAPLLWRLLRESSTSQLENLADLREFNRLHEALWEAAGRRPFGFPTVPDDEGYVLPAQMRMEARGQGEKIRKVK